MLIQLKQALAEIVKVIPINIDEERSYDQKKLKFADDHMISIRVSVGTLRTIKRILGGKG